jgi:threonine dehydratase
MRLKIKKTGSFRASKKYLDLISKSKVYDVAINTPISFAGNLSTKLENEVFLKSEDMQPIFSFKLEAPTIRLLI